MSEKVTPRIMKGLRDFLPEDMIKRNFVIDILKKTFESHGFLPVETPAIEMWDILSGKYGEEGEQLIYRFSDRGERDLGLRYDLTVPLSRVAAMYQHKIVKPFKRYQIQPVWRADKPGKGRFREFYQCDMDIIGCADTMADAEVIATAHDGLKKLGFRNFVIKFNSRKILRGMVELSGAGIEKEADICTAIDKLDKIGFEGVEKELLNRGVSPESKDKIIEFIKIKGTPQEVILQSHSRFKDSESAQKGIEEMSALRKLLDYMGVPESNLMFDLSLARGLNYYTGPIFETVVEKPKIGSVSGGGRYDNLIGQYVGTTIPATGNSIGLERIITVMEELGMYPDNLGFGIKVLICRFPDEDLSYSLKLAARLRSEGINTEVYLNNSKLRGQLGYAEDRNIPIAVIAGGNELKEGNVVIKDMKKREQVTTPDTDIVAKIHELLA
jgi:histidyl-tRNA synthetase